MALVDETIRVTTHIPLHVTTKIAAIATTIPLITLETVKTDLAAGHAVRLGGGTTDRDRGPILDEAG